MPESVEAAREALNESLREAVRKADTPVLVFALADYNEKRDGFEVEIRASERNRLLNPSDELVEAVAKAMQEHLWATGTSTVSIETMRVAARAALQAAGKI